MPFNGKHSRSWKSPRVRKTEQLLMRARQRRRTWSLLEGNAGEDSGWVRSMLQVRYSKKVIFPVSNEGHIYNSQNWGIRQEYVVPKPKFKFISETWILPFAVLFAMVAYAVLAIIFYKFDSWFQFNCVYDKLWYQHYFNYKSKKF